LDTPSYVEYAVADIRHGVVLQLGLGEGLKETACCEVLNRASDVDKVFGITTRLVGNLKGRDHSGD